MDWEKYSFIVSSEIRIRVLKALKQGKTPTQIAQKIDAKTSHVSRTLSEFIKKGIAECMTPKAKVGRVYKLTTLGEEILTYYSDSMEK